VDNHQNLPDNSDHDLHDGSCGGRHSTEVEESVQRDSWVDKIDDVLRVAEVDGEEDNAPLDNHDDALVEKIDHGDEEDE